MKTLKLLILLCLFTPELLAQDTASTDSVEFKKLTLLNHRKYMRDLFGEPSMQIKTVGILVYDGMFTLDAIGPMSVMSELMETDVYYIGLKKGLVKSGRTKIMVEKTIDEVDQLDILIVPGGSVGTWEAGQDTTILNWIRKMDKTTQITASVCTGAWILGEAGLLQGKQATTHWYEAENMLKRYGATFVRKRYVEDGKYWTSAGVTAGMDMCLALVQKIRGDKYVQGSMLDLEYDPQPPVNAGTPAKSDPEVVHMMKSMYDYGMQPLIKKADKKKAKAAH